MFASAWLSSPPGVPSTPWKMLLPSDVARLVLGKGGHAREGVGTRLRWTEGPLEPKVFPGWGSFGVSPPRLQVAAGGGSASCGGSGRVQSLVGGCCSQSCVGRTRVAWGHPGLAPRHRQACALNWDP